MTVTRPVERRNPCSLSRLAVPLQIAMLLAVAAVTGCAKPAADSPAAEQAASGSLPQSTVVAIGSLEPAGGIISISAAPGDRVKLLDPDITVNGAVPTNGLLGLMASYDTRRAQLTALETKRELTGKKHALDVAMATARVTSAQAQLAQAEAKLTEIKLQKRRLPHLEEAAAIAADDLRRLIELSAADPELVTRHQLRRQQNQVDQAQEDFDIANDQYASGLRAAQSAYDAAVANKTAAQESLDKLNDMDPVLAVDQEIVLAKQALAQTVLLTPDQDRTKLDATKLRFELDGPTAAGPYSVLRLFLRPGEAVTQTPVMQVANLSQIVCVAEVHETDAKNIVKGQKAKLTSKAFAKPYDLASNKWINGTVDTVSRVVASAGIAPRNPLAPVDRSVVKVRVIIDGEDAAAVKEASRWIGLRVQVAFEDPS